MSVIPFERRRRRSTNTFEAIKLQLQYIQQERDLANFVLADDRGLLVAHAGRADDAHVLAAYAPMVAESANRDVYFEALESMQQHIPEITPTSVAIRSFEVDGHVLHLAIQARSTRLRHDDVYRAVAGVRRILGETSRVAA